MFLTASNAVLLVPQLSVCCCCGSGAKNDKIYCPQFGCTGAAWQCYPPDAFQCLCGLGLNLISLSSYLKCTELPSCNILLSTLYWHNMNFARIKVDSREGAMALFQLVLLFLAPFLSLTEPCDAHIKFHCFSSRWRKWWGEKRASTFSFSRILHVL